MPADILVKKSEGVYVINKKQFYPMGVINFSQTSRKRQRPCATCCKSAAATAHHMLSRRKRPRAARTAAAVSACAGSRVFTIGRATLRSHTHTLHARCTHAARPHARTHTHAHGRAFFSTVGHFNACNRRAASLL